jgi:hypothetical protein
MNAFIMDGEINSPAAEHLFTSFAGGSSAAVGASVEVDRPASRVCTFAANSLAEMQFCFFCAQALHAQAFFLSGDCGTHSVAPDNWHGAQNS